MNPILLELRFRAIAPIRDLPFYHGPQWSALFRNALRPFLPAGCSLAAGGIWVQPVDTGILAYDAGEPMHVGLCFSPAHRVAVCRMLGAFNHLYTTDGHFRPGLTLRLEHVLCRVSGREWSLQELQADKAGFGPLRLPDLEPEIEFLSGIDRFSLVFHTPLRLTRPAGEKEKGHRYCDEAFFLAPEGDSKRAVGHLIGKLRIPLRASDREEPIEVSRGGLVWLDVPYGRGAGAKTLGGVMGRVHVQGRPSRETAARLVEGQYAGCGKNAAFGFGFFTIPELDGVRKISVPTRGLGLAARALSAERLRDALARSAETSPGPDGIGYADIRKAGAAFLEHLARRVAAGSYEPGAARTYRIPKHGGGYREIRVHNAADRLVQKALADFLSGPVDRLLSSSAWAFRAGLNRLGAATALREHLGAGYTAGVKADIASFFDNVNLDALEDTLAGLFAFDPLPPRVMGALRASGSAGLPQGSPLSPVLSNLYLSRFDREMAGNGFKLIRYADDFVVLFKGAAAGGRGMEAVRSSLAGLGLRLNADKTVPIAAGEPVRFLGYLVDDSEIRDGGKEGDDDEPWSPVFREDWTGGTPVYLSSVCRGAYSSGPDLVIKDEQDREAHVPWNRISRLVVVGRSAFSGGVVYRAVREEIPVTFIDVMGRARGSLHPSGHEIPEMGPLQETCAADASYCLDFAREIIAAKIHNSSVLLRRNGVNEGGLKELAEKARTSGDLDSLRGIEGFAARTYFAALAGLVQPFEFRGRVYRPPDGPVNVMLSFGYTLLYNRLGVVLKDKGFNARLGFFHRGRGGHLALASDLVEELRHLAERVVLALIHRGEVGAHDFRQVQSNGISLCRMEGEGFRKFIRRYEQVMASTFTCEGQKMSYNAFLDEMADRLKRSLRLGIPYRGLRIS